MKRSISLWQFLGFAVTAFGGTLLHFLYEWTGKSMITALISGVNESTWEHMKLLFFPMFFFALIQSFFFKDIQGFWCVKLRGILLGLLLIPVLFYTYNGIFGESPDWINIMIFFLSAASAFLWETRLFHRENTPCRSPKLSFIILCLIALLFVVFTFFTPEIEIFRDPVTGTYGI